MIQTIFNHSWAYWGLIILFGMPVSLLVTNEGMQYLSKRNSNFYGVFASFRNFIIPVLFVYLLLKFVIELDAESTYLKIASTVLWILLIHSTLKFINTLVFSEALPEEIRNRIPKLLVDFLRTFLVLLGAAFVMSAIWGADLGRLLTALGVGSVVLGLALQDVLGGLFSGLALLSSRPFSVNDWIKVGETEGKVINIDWRAVSIATRENDVVTIPNSVLAKEQFENYLRPNPYHMERIGFDISFDDPPTKVKRLLTEAADATNGILKEPNPVAALISYDEFSIHYEVRYFIEDYDKQPEIRNDYVSRIWYINKRFNVTFPTRAHEVYTFNGDKQVEENKLNDIATRLKDLSVLDINDNDLEELANHSVLETYGNGECMAWQGQVAENFYIILEGEAVEKKITDKGKVTTARKFARGDFFGVAGMIRRTPHVSNIVAQGDVEVLAIERRPMQKVLQLNPRIAQSLESIIESRGRNMKKAG